MDSPTRLDKWLCDEKTEFKRKLAVSEAVRNTIATRAVSDNRHFDLEKLKELLSGVLRSDCLEFPTTVNSNDNTNLAVEFGKLYCGPYHLPGFDMCILNRGDNQDGNSLLLIQITNAQIRNVFDDLRKAAVPIIRAMQHPVHKLYFIYATIAKDGSGPRLSVSTQFDANNELPLGTLLPAATNIQVETVYLYPVELYRLTAVQSQGVIVDATEEDDEDADDEDEAMEMTVADTCPGLETEQLSGATIEEDSSSPPTSSSSTSTVTLNDGQMTQ